ncbi:MAG: protein kinase [Labilithrix sp.]|nr:protein kinase [Labilithrix sp.]MCW5812194.1 protein kinase [Labilithrix sp.]
MDAPAVSIGTVVAGRYRVDDVLGEGGMGAVWAVVDVETGAPLALKVVLEATPEHVARFGREAKATMRIQSAHVVRVVDVGTIEDTVPFMVMERLEGETLKDLVADGPLPDRAVADLFLQACEGLAHAHALGIVHRDVKPSNLFVLAGRERTLKVLDFGIARMTSYEAYENREKTTTVTDSAALLGSPQYVSPEQLQSPSSVDERADVWSLGISMYLALTGTLPFSGSSLAEVLVAVMSKPTPPLGSKASPAMAAIVQRCLTRSLDDRFRRVSDLAEALAPLASPERAALLPRIRAVAASAAPIVAPVPPSKLRDPNDKTFTLEDSLDEKATVQDLRSQRPASLGSGPLPPIGGAEPVTGTEMAAAMTAPSMRKKRRARSVLGLAFGAGLVVTIAAGGLVVNRLRARPPLEQPEPPLAELPLAEPPAATSVAATSSVTEPAGDPPLELIADGAIAKVVRPTRQRVELLEDGKALLRVGAVKSDLAIEVELANGARAKGVAKPGGPTTIRLVTVPSTKPKPGARPPPKPASTPNELHKSPYD